MNYEFETLSFTIENNIGVMTLNTPPFNLLSVPMLLDIEKLLYKLENEKDLRCIIVTGAGEKSFCAGADVGDLIEPTSKDLDVADVFGRDLLTKWASLPCPTIAVINGFAFGGGMELALACDIRIASETAKMGLTETKLGMIASWGGSQRMPRIIGVSNAKKLIFTAEKITASEAYRIGLVEDVVSSENLMSFAMDMAKKIASNSPVANRLAKTAINHYMNSNIYDGFDLERKCGKLVYESEDSKEGMLAFKEKRTPIYKNK